MLRHLGRAARQFSTNTPSPASAWERFWAWTLQQRPSWRESPKEAAVIFVVFGITGSTSVGVVRPALKNTIGLEGSMREGPWSYRITSLLAVSPIYATFLVTFGTIAGLIIVLEPDVRQRRRAACNSATAQREERVTTGRPPAPPAQQRGALEIQSSHPRGSCH